MDRLQRRDFLIGVGAILAAPLAVYAQSTGKAWRIGYLREGRAPLAPSLLEAMRKLGWVEGRNIMIEPRYADQPEQLPDLAAELVRLKVDLIIVAGWRSTQAAKEATTSIPIVFSIAADPVEKGFVASMARPGWNLTGFALGLYDDKQLEVLKETLPGLTRVAYPVFRDVEPPGLKVAKTLGVEALGIAVQSPAEFRPFFVAAKAARADAALIPDSARLTPHLESVGAEAWKSRLPAIGFRRIFAETGGLLSYAPITLERQAREAAQIDRILRGAAPADLPVEQPTKFELVINLKTAKSLGLTIPQSVLVRADEVIQ